MSNLGRDDFDGSPELPVDPDQIVDDGGPLDRPSTRKVLLAIATAGAIGSLCRYAMTELIGTSSNGFPWSILWTNLIGSFLIGIVLIVVPERYPKRHLGRPILATGLIGSYTTFSTYVVGVDLLVRSHDLGTAVEYLFISLLGGILAVFAGVKLAHTLLRTGRQSSSAAQ